MGGNEDSRDMRFGRFAAIVITAALAAAGCSMAKPLKTVSHVDLPRYMGDWYVIANIPYFAEKGCVDSIESYKLRPDGKIDNWFTCRKDSFQAPMKRKATAVAVVKDTETNATWTVWFFKVIPIRYAIVDLDPNYQWVAVGHPSRRYGWVMARAKTLPEATYQTILRSLAAQGYDPGKFVKVPQQAAADAPADAPAGAASTAGPSSAKSSSASR